MTGEIIARLRSLDLSDGGSHSRLSAIASCFYQPTFGWTRGACETLRDKLIETVEGKYGNNDNNSPDGCDRNHHRCYQRQVSYDVLSNERHKAVCELRRVPDARTSENTYDKTVELIYAALGLDCEIAGTFEGLNDLRDRLIHLLGGDEPTLSDLYGIWQDGEESESRGSESAHKMTKSAEIGKLGEHAKQLEHDVEMWRDRAEDMRMERDELQEKNRCLAEKCDAMLVLLGNGAKITKSDQERRIEKLVRQRDELREKLKVIGGIVNG